MDYKYEHYEASSMAWNLPGDVRALAAALALSGCTELWVKAGVDNPGLRNVWAQWSDGRCDTFLNYNVNPLAWFYIYPESGATQWDTISRALMARSSKRICLNAEVEWDDTTSDFVNQWWAGLRSTLTTHGIDLPIGFSSVPSWDKNVGATGSKYHGFPYESFCKNSDFSMPQAYFGNAPDEILWENPRNTTNHPVIPILWAPGNFPGVTPPAFSDDQIVSYARQLMTETENFAGFSAWVAELPTYQHSAMKRVYDLFPTAVKSIPITPTPVNGQLSHAAIELDISDRLTFPQLGGVEGRGMVTLPNGEFPFVEWQKYRSIAIGNSVEGFFVDPANPVSFDSLDKGGKIRWL